MKNKKLFAILTLVCFMFTLMPVAAFAATFDEQASYVSLGETAIEAGDTVKVELDLNETTSSLYVWFEEVGYENVVVNAVTADGFTQEDPEGISGVSGSGVITVNLTANYAEFDVQVNRDGEFVVHAGTVAPAASVDWDDVAAAELRVAGDDTVVVDPADSESDKYAVKVVKVADTTVNQYIEDNKSYTMNVTKTDGAYVTAVALKLLDPARNDTTGVIEGDGTAISALDVEIDTTSGVEVTNVEVKRSGSITFDVAATKVGSHKIYITIGDYKGTIKVDATTSVADEIELDSVSKTPVNIDYAKGNLTNYILFKVYDSNGNEVKTATATNGIWGAANSATAGAERNYVALTDKPADSKLTSKNFKVSYQVGNDGAGWTIVAPATGFDEEGKYTFKVTLDNGEYATGSITVMEAGDPVALSITYNTNTVELGSDVTPKAIGWLDANYVFTAVWDAAYGFIQPVEFAVSGAAVESVDTTDDVTITVKENEKYIGEKINVTVVDEENDLVATTTLTVASEAKELAFVENAAPVDSQKNINVRLVDEDGNAVSLTNATTAEAYVVVMDKPADSEVDADVVSVKPEKGVMTISFACDTVGVVKLQAVLKVTEGTSNGVVRYYTGVGEIKVGATGIEDTVVMSIGANKIVVNDEVVAIDAAPMIKDSRTFVPFRALAEAFGAVVEFDAATQAVVAELDGTKVVMTIGSEVYTVNGVAKTADVAPFISDSRTMVPVRFAAEAFGITVTPIYAEDGSVADVLFTK